MKSAAGGCLAALALLAGVRPADANLIQNGGFETGELHPWQVWLGQVSVEGAGFLGLFSPYEGNYMAVLSPDTETSSALVQTDLGTGSDPLILSFYYNLIAYNEGSQPASDYAELYFNGSVLASAALADPVGGSYTETGWQFASWLVAPGAATQSWIGFVLWNDELCDASSPEQRALVLLDRVSLRPVPDTGSTALLVAVAVGVVLSAGFWLSPRGADPHRATEN